MAADPRGRAPACCAGVDFYLGYSPERIDPGQPDWTFENTPKVVSGIDAASLERGPGPSTTASSTGPCPVSQPQGGRADQAAREHLPPRQHRAGQRAGHVRRRPRHRRLGGHRRRLHQAVRLHALHPRARASAATACRSTRRYLSWRVRQLAGPGLPLRRARQRRQRPHARLRRAPPGGRAQRAAVRRSTAAASCCSAWPTRRTPATPGSRRPRSIARQLLALGADVRGADPHVADDEFAPTA